MTKLTVKQMPTKDLVPYANNARIHSVEQIETIKASIEQFGFNDPVGVWTNKNGQLEIVEGHGRVMAAEQLGLEKVPTINLDHLTDEQRRAYSIVHNQTTDNSVFDFAILDQEIESLDFDWEEFGFTLSDLEQVNATTEDVKPDIPFSEELGRENNYLVLKFDNDIDWINAQTVFGIGKAKRFSTRQDGYLSESMTMIGIGRVLNGAEAIAKLVGE